MKPSRSSEYRAWRNQRKNAVKFNVDTSALNDILSNLESSIYEALRPSAQAGAQIIYDEVKKNVAKIGVSTGRLSNSIYQVYSKRDSIEGMRAIYNVSWNPAKAKHGHLLEYGHIQQFVTFESSSEGWITLKGKPLKDGPRHVAARPFISPALVKMDAALAAVEDELMKRIDGIDESIIQRREGYV